MVYDCFTFFNELDVLEIRLNILNSIVDRFVLVEATKTHQGKDKPLVFSENKSRFAEFEDKIIHIVVDSFPRQDNSWTFERYQRDMIMEGLKNAGRGDVIIVSDVDEIPSPEQVEKYRNREGIKIFRQRSYYYYLNCININEGVEYKWCGTVMARYKPGITPQVLRYISIQFAALYSNRMKVRAFYALKMLYWKIKLRSNIYAVENGGWHFSFLGGVEMIIKKLEAFAHAEYNKDEYKSPEKIAEALKEGKDLFGRNFKYEFVQIDKSFPEYLQINQEKYKKLIHQ